MKLTTLLLALSCAALPISPALAASSKTAAKAGVDAENNDAIANPGHMTMAKNAAACKPGQYYMLNSVKNRGTPVPCK